MLLLRPYEVQELKRLIDKLENGWELCISKGCAGEDFEPLMSQLIVCCISSAVADNEETED